MQKTQLRNYNDQTIAVLGPNGVQGASVLHHLLKTAASTTHIRALTQSPKSQQEQSLPSTNQYPNLSIHQADGLSFESLKSAFTDCNIVFANTNSSDPRFTRNISSGDNPLEFTAMKHIVNACIECEVELLILSVSEEFGPVARHSTVFNAKSLGRRYAEACFERGELNVVFVTLGWYFSNFVTFYPPSVNAEDGTVEFWAPWAKIDTKVPWVSPYTDLGPVIKAIMDNPTPYLGKNIPVASENMSLEDLAQVYEKVTSQKTRAVHRHASIAEHDKQPSEEEVTSELLELYYIMAVYNSGEYLKKFYLGSGRYLELDALLHESGLEKMTTWEEWLRNTCFDVMKDSFGEKIAEKMKSVGGLRFL